MYDSNRNQWDQKRSNDEEEDLQMAMRLSRQMRIGDVNTRSIGSSSHFTSAFVSGASKLDSFPQFTAVVKSLQCSQCSTPIFQSQADITERLQAFKDGRGVLSSLLECNRCSCTTCIACKPNTSARNNTVRCQGKELSWCCTGGRTILLWLLLCGFDEHYSTVRSREAASSRPQGAYKQHNWMGYGASPYAAPMRRPVLGSAGNAAAGDRFYTLFIELLEPIVPSVNGTSEFDCRPPSVVGDLLCESKLLDFCAALMRTNTPEEAVKQDSLFTSVIKLIHTLASHTVTMGAVFNNRRIRDDKENLLGLTFANRIEQPKEEGQPLFKCLENLNAASALVVSNRQATGSQNLVRLCTRITDLYKFLKSKCDKPAAAQAMTQTKEICPVSEEPDRDIFMTHAFANRASAMYSAHQPGRLKRIMKEIMTLRTSLPPNIFVRYAEGRPDVMKILIMGPVGTPYENGIFEFDLFCGPNFPQESPQMIFKTTGGGMVGFNPNLYAEGKVCLSLLGTWAGEPWRPNESTILQLLVSIQAMILCEHPYYNEPGRGGDMHTSGRAQAYNSIISQHTVKIAILGWLNPPKLWKDIVTEHFKANANNILKTVEKWAKSKRAPSWMSSDEFNEVVFETQPRAMFGAPGMPAWGPVVSEVQKAMQKYGATYTPTLDLRSAATQAPPSSNMMGYSMIPAAAAPMFGGRGTLPQAGPPFGRGSPSSGQAFRGGLGGRGMGGRGGFPRGGGMW